MIRERIHLPPDDDDTEPEDEIIDKINSRKAKQTNRGYGLRGI